MTHSFKENDITVNIYTNIIDWAKEFYDMPEGAILDNEEEVSKEVMGFADVDNKVASIFIPKSCNIQDVKDTIAHEIGHIIQIQGLIESNYESLEGYEEAKADCFMNYYKVTQNVIQRALLGIKDYNE